MERIGPYEIVGEVGRGGMGVVYRAVDAHIGREVAVKTIRFADLADPDEQEQLRGRLFREARAAGILKHPGIVTIYYVGEEQGVAFIAMEFVNGPSLEKLLLADTPLDKERIRQILRETAAALDYAHKKGVIHRDVKPANIMLEDNEVVKICDFGIAKGFSGFSAMTQTGTVIGTPHYMPPEQIQGKGVDARADQYALAVIAFQMLTGRRPFQADSIQTLFYRIMMDSPEKADEVNPTLPAAVSEVFERALAKEAGNRYATCGGFVAELLAACDTLPDWSPLSRKGLTSSGSTPSRSARPAPPSVAPEPPPPSPPVSLPPESVEATPEPPVSGFKVPESQPEPVPPPKPGGGRCQHCGGAVQPGLDLCPICANFGLTPPPQPAPGEGSAEPVPSVEEQALEPVARAALGAEPGVTAPEESGDAKPEVAAQVGFTTAFADVVPAQAPAPVSVPPEQEKPSEEIGEPLQALTEPSATPTPVREEETADRLDTNLKLPPNWGLSAEPERAKRRRMLVALLAAAAGLAMIVGGFWLNRGRAERLRIVEFTSDREAAEPLQPVVLRWKVAGADSSRIAPGVGSVPPAGEMTVHPKVSTTYTLEAVRTGETLSAQVAVIVAKPTGPSGPSQELQARLAEARDFLKHGLYDNAIAAYQVILAADSGNRQAQAGIAEARAAKEAELRLSGGGGAPPQDALRKAQRLHNNGEYEAAIAAFEQVLAAEPGNARAKQGLAAARAADEAEKRLR